MTLILGLASLLALILLPFVMLLACVLAGAVLYLLPGFLRAGKTQPNSPSFLIVIPAHNEEECIGRTLTSLAALDYPQDLFRVLVLADNCSDDTAGIARRYGAYVYERQNQARRGKGYALEELFTWLSGQREFAPYHWICVIDADSRVAPDYLRQVEVALARGFSWYQTDDAVANWNDSWRTRLLAWAFALFNGVWQMGCDRIGIGAALRGNGMILARDGLARIPWRASGLAEDLEMSWSIKLSGERIGYIRQARVFADMPTVAATSESQRQRWEHGRQAVRRMVPGRLARARLSPWSKLIHLAELLMPGISTFGVMLLAGLSIASLDLFLAAADIDGGFHLVRIYYLSALAILVLYALSPFFLMKLNLRVLTGVFAVPVYIGWRLLVLIKSVPTHWVRTVREKSER